MVRTYKRTSTRGSYGGDRLALAVAAVGNGQNIHGAGAEYGISRRTLRRHCIGAVRLPCHVDLGRKRCVFSDVFEKELVGYAQEMAKRMYGLTTNDMKRLAYAVAAKLGVDNKFDNERCLAGKDWLSSFMKRHPTLSIRAPISTSMARVDGFNRAAVAMFFTLYKSIITAGTYSATHIWNCDETGLTTVAKSGTVLGATAMRQIRKVSSGERGKNITALCCISAAGAYIPPLFVFPRKRMVPSLMIGTPAGAIGEVNARGSGYIDSSLFMTWLRHFAAVAGCNKENPHVLLLDGHESHKTLDAIDFGRENGIILITFPPHCTHRLQPLDRTYFKSLKSAFSRAFDNWLVTNRGRIITQYDVIPLFEQAYSSSATVATAVNGFVTCGLWPFNDAKFDAEFDLLELPLPQPDDAMQPLTTGDTATPPSVVAQLSTPRDSVLHPSSMHVNRAQPLQQQARDPTVSVERSDFRSAIVHCSPPLPTRKTTRNVRRSASAILTSSPYKRLVEEKRGTKKCCSTHTKARKSTLDQRSAQQSIAVAGTSGNSG